MVNPEKARGNMNKALMKFLAVDLMPPSVVEGKGFRYFHYIKYGD